MLLKPNEFKKMMALPVMLITTVDAQGVNNAAPFSCVMPILKPLDLIVFACFPGHDTLRNVRETNEFVINIAGRPSFRQAIRCAKKYPPEVDELQEVEMATVPAREVKPLRMKDAIGWIECRLHKEIAESDHSLLVGKVVCAESNDAYISDGRQTEFPIMNTMPWFRLLGEAHMNRKEFDDVLPSD